MPIVDWMNESVLEFHGLRPLLLRQSLIVPSFLGVCFLNYLLALKNQPSSLSPWIKDGAKEHLYFC